MKTEEDAKKLWCPMVRTEITPNIARCRASACMMWRWLLKDKREDENKGYCGLAGKPT